MAIGVFVVSVRLVPCGVPLPLLLYLRGGRGYKEDNRVGYNIILIRTLSLLIYFTYIHIDIIIYAFASTPWFSEIFWMVGRFVKDPSLGLSSPCEVVPWVLILITDQELWTHELMSRIKGCDHSLDRKDILKFIYCFMILFLIVYI
jgi:hypothetical protein